MDYKRGQDGSYWWTIAPFLRLGQRSEPKHVNKLLVETIKRNNEKMKTKKKLPILKDRKFLANLARYRIVLYYVKQL